MVNNSVPATRTSLDSLLREKCKISAARDFQLEHGMDLIKGEDLFLVAAPGFGKTIVMSAPLLYAQERSETGIAIVVVPSKILTEQQARCFSKYGLQALAINEDTLRNAHYDDRDLIKEIADGTGVRTAVVTPWMLKNDKLQEILCSGKTRLQVRWFFVDEAHLVNKNDPSVWREPYASLLLMRARLPPTTIWVGMTGTATRSETLHISHLLGFQPGLFKNARHTVDRKNIKLIPRFLAHPFSGSQFLDLSFLVPDRMVSSADIATTLLFCDTIELGHRVICFLDSLLPADLPNRDKIIELPTQGIASPWLSSQGATQCPENIGAPAEKASRAV